SGAARRDRRALDLRRPAGQARRGSIACQQGHSDLHGARNLRSDDPPRVGGCVASCAGRCGLQRRIAILSDAALGCARGNRRDQGVPRQGARPGEVARTAVATRARRLIDAPLVKRYISDNWGTGRLPGFPRRPTRPVLLLTEVVYPWGTFALGAAPITPS